MAIVVGTDFSERSRAAAQVAAALARHMGTTCTLVHVTDTPAAGLMHAAPDGRPVATHLRERLENEAADLALAGATVEPLLLEGVADEALVAEVRRKDASLLIVSALGQRRSGPWPLGSTAERVAHLSSVPVLVVRDASSLLRWLRGDEPLRMAVGVDFSAPSHAALTWAAEFRRLGVTHLTLLHVAWPPEEHRRLGLDAPMPVGDLHPDVRNALERELADWVGPLPGDGAVDFSVHGGLGRVDHHLVSLAEESGSQLCVVGTHHRAGLDLLRHGSISRGLLHLAPMNVVVVPHEPEAARPAQVPNVQRVLAASDLSPLAARAVAQAAALTPKGGKLHLVHVASAREDDKEAHRRLLASVPEGIAQRGVVVTAEILHGPDVAQVLADAAERFDADLVCVGRRGASGLARLMPGRVAEALVRRVQRPVVIVS